MWNKIVDRAIDERVDAVLLSGDIVDHENRYYEATGPFEKGIVRLADARIQTCAVAGNHDWDVFPRILRQLNPQLFHFLGRGGRWEEAFLEREGRRILRIVGWSFPDQYVLRSPLEDLPARSDAALPTVGLLHADVDASGSKFCPVRLSELQATGPAFWVLGHIHKPQHYTSKSGPHVLNPGSPQALAPDEPGPHGPWLVEIEGARLVDCRQLPLSLVRYEDRDVDLAGVSSDDDFDTRVYAAMLTALEAVAGGGQQAELLSLRLNLTGSTTLCGRIGSLAPKREGWERPWAGVTARIDKCTNRTRPTIDLATRSQQNDLLGVLARTLVALERNEVDDSVAGLLDDATARLQEVRRASAYRGLDGAYRDPSSEDPVPTQEDARKVLVAQGWQLLEALRAQVPEREETL